MSCTRRAQPNYKVADQSNQWCIKPECLLSVQIEKLAVQKIVFPSEDPIPYDQKAAALTSTVSEGLVHTLPGTVCIACTVLNGPL